MNRNMTNITLSLFTILLFVSGCGMIDVYEFDHMRPEITVNYPPDEAVIGENGITVHLDASDDEGVVRVEFYINAHHDTSADDTQEPFEYALMNPNTMNIETGRPFTLFAKAFDARDNEMISNFVPLYYQWRPLIQDKDEPMNSNIDEVFVRSTSSSLEFRVTTFDDWRNIGSKSGLNCAFFLDTDQNAATGHHAQQIPDTPVESFLGEDNPLYQVNNIGPEYAVILGIEGNRLYQWDEDSLHWQGKAELSYIEMKSDTNVAALGVPLSDIGNPQAVDLVVARITYSDSTYWDWAPDTSHVEYKIDGLFLNE
ncbi:hypothetical protein JXB12_03015 [candidate division KSB1 bacterium]|nr:hypothetical protein [candidate division KSB1 bacterium]